MIEMVVGEIYQCVATHDGTPVEDGGIWLIMRIEDGVAYGKRPNYPVGHEGTPLAMSSQWVRVDREKYDNQVVDDTQLACVYRTSEVEVDHTYAPVNTPNHHVRVIARAAHVVIAESDMGSFVMFEDDEWLHVSDNRVQPATICTCCGEQGTTTVVSNSGLCPQCTDAILIERNPLSPSESSAYVGIKAALRLANETAVAAGWYTDRQTGQRIERNFGEVVALMHSELSEALEADRKTLQDTKLPYRDGREVEFADTWIRMADTSQDLDFDLAGAFIEKNRFNKLRRDHQMSSRNATNGKAY